jgi:hypothetical protein
VPPLGYRAQDGRLLTIESEAEIGRTHHAHLYHRQ